MTCDLGAMAVGEVTEVHIIVTAPQEKAILINNASVEADELDIHLEDNVAVVVTRMMVFDSYLPIIMR